MKGFNQRRITPLPEPKRPESGFWNGAVPSVCTIPLQQHTGGELKPTVAVGDTVREGSIIAEGSGRLITYMHAPIPGVVSEIGTMEMVDGRRSKAVSIQLSGEFDRLGKVPGAHPWEDLDIRELLDLILEGGVIDTGRTGLPVHALLDRRHTLHDARIVLNIAQTEPYYHSDFQVARQYPRQIVESLQIVRKITGAVDTVIVLGRHHRREGKRFRKAMEISGYSVRFLPYVYPADLDHQIVRQAFGITLGMEERALDRNVFILNAGTLVAVYEAVVLRKPQIDRVVTVAGGAVHRPANVRVRIGTPVADILQECGGLVTEDPVILVGGPLSGRRVNNINTPITKRDEVVLALTREELVSPETLPCIGCGACFRTCPVSLDPIYLVRLIEKGSEDEAIQAGLYRCVECGLCSHVCPSRVPLVQTIRNARISHRAERHVTATEGETTR